MRSRITLRQLEAFLALGRTLNFGEAARQVHVSQPALSATIRKLEAAFSAPLFDRTTRKVALSPVGAELLRTVDVLIDDFDAGMASVRDYVLGKRGRLSVAASPSLAAAFLPEVIAAFEPEHPGVTVQVHDALSDVSIDMVRNGKADLALAPEKAEDAELTHRELFHDRLVMLCRADHPLAASRTVTWQQLQRHRLVSLTRSSSVRHLVDAAYVEQGGPLRPAFEVEHASTVIGFVANGLGVGVLPLSLLPLVKVGLVTYRRITAPEIHRAICVVTLKSRSLSPVAKAFVDLCVTMARERRAGSADLAASASGRPRQGSAPATGRRQRRA